MGFKHSFRQIKKLPDWIYILPAALLKLLFRCAYRVTYDDPDNLRFTTKTAIGLAWHNRLLFFPAAFAGPLARNTMAVISASRDGQYVADFIARFGIGALRGSSSRGGAAAQLGALKALKDGKFVVFTPDGPRGPRYRLKKGPIQLASLSGVPIALISINASRAWHLSSWDQFQLPCPGAKLTVVIRGLYHIPSDLDAEQLAEHTARIEQEFLKITCDPF